MHSITLRDFGMGWTRIGNGWYHWIFDHLQIDNSYIGMGFDPAGMGSYAFWGNQADFLWLRGVRHNALRPVSPVAIGMPVNLFRHFKVFNTNTPVVADDAAIVICAVELDVEGFDLEGWRNRIAYFIGGPSVTYRRMHVEHHTWDQPNDWTIYAAKGPVTIEDGSFASLAGTTVAPGAVLFETDTGGNDALDAG